MIFVFGSNCAGVHGAGAAKYAHRMEGAVWGKGLGQFGNSYALPTKGFDIRTLPLSTVRGYITQFKIHAYQNPGLTFKVTRVGCGLAGFRDRDIAPLFAGCPSNCCFDTAWAPWLGDRLTRRTSRAHNAPK